MVLFECPVCMNGTTVKTATDTCLHPLCKDCHFGLKNTRYFGKCPLCNGSYNDIRSVSHILSQFLSKDEMTVDERKREYTDEIDKLESELIELKKSVHGYIVKVETMKHNEKTIKAQCHDIHKYYDIIREQYEEISANRTILDMQRLEIKDIETEHYFKTKRVEKLELEIKDIIKKKNALENKNLKLYNKLVNDLKKPKLKL